MLRQVTFGINFGIRDNQLRQANQRVNLLKRNVNQSSTALGGLGAAAITAGRQMKAAFSSTIALLERYRFYIMGAFFALGGAIGGATKAAGDFRYQIKTTGLVAEATGKEIEKLTKNAKQLGIETAFTAKEAAEGQEILARAGFEVEQVIETLPAVLDAAAIEEMKLSRASEIMTGALKGMRMEVDQSRRVIDVLADTSRSSKATINSLGESLPQVAATASGLGVEIEMLSAALGLLADQETKGSRAGRLLRGVFQSLSDPTSEAKSMLKKYKIDLWDANDNFKSLTGVVKEFETALSGLTQKEKRNVLGSILPARRSIVMMQLLNAGSEELANFNERLENSQGVAEMMAEEQLDTLIGAFKRLKGSINVAAINIGDFFVPKIAGAVDSVTGLINVFNDAPPATQKFASGILGTTGLVLGLATAAAFLRKPIIAVAGILKTWGATLGTTASTIGWTIAIVTGLWLAFEDLYYTMEHGYQGVLQPMIDKWYDFIGIGVSFRYTWEYAKWILGEFFSELQDLNKSIGRLSKGIGQAIIGIFTFDTDTLMESWNNLWEGIKGIAFGVPNVFWSVLNIAKTVVSSVVVFLVRSIGQIIKTGIENVLKSIGWLLGKALPDIDIKLPDMIGKLGEWWSNIQKWINNNIANIGQIISEKLGFTGDVINKVFGFGGDNNSSQQPGNQSNSQQSVNVKVKTPGGTEPTNLTQKSQSNKVEQNNSIEISVEGSDNPEETGKKVREELERYFEIIETEEGLGGASL